MQAGSKVQIELPTKRNAAENFLCRNFVDADTEIQRILQKLVEGVACALEQGDRCTNEVEGEFCLADARSLRMLGAGRPEPSALLLTAVDALRVVLRDALGETPGCEQPSALEFRMDDSWPNGVAIRVRVHLF